MTEEINLQIVKRNYLFLFNKLHNKGLISDIYGQIQISLNL